MPSHHSNTLSKPTVRPESRLQRYDGFRFAILASPLLGPEPFVGRASFQRDDLLGNILRISLEGNFAGAPEIIVAEKDWQGLITSGQAYGCDYCLSLIREETSATPTGSADSAKKRKGPALYDSWRS